MSYLSLEEAAAKLGISTDRLIDLRSQGQIRGFRDGSSWKFPENEIDRLADDLAADGAGSGIMVDQGEDFGSIGSVIGGDAGESGEGSDVNVGSETLKEGSTGSDVNLVTGNQEDGSDVELVASGEAKQDDKLDQDSLFETDDAELLEIDSAELQLNDPAIMHESNDSIDIAVDPKEGSTGPVAKAEAAEEAEKISISDVDVGDDSGPSEQDASLAEEDSEDLLIGEDSESVDLESFTGGDAEGKSAGASSLELMNELETPGGEKSQKSSGADVLSELDLLGAEQSDSGVISGDSENLLQSGGGSGLDAGVAKEMDDALDEDDDLVIADDDADLMLDSVSDISVAGDSGINLMSPSDSGLSLESEPLDLAGSSLSALDLGAELSEGSGVSGGSSGKGSDAASGSGSGSDEEFQLSPSGIGLDADVESSSQVIEVEDSEVAEAVDLEDDFGQEQGFAEADFADAEALGPDAFEEGPAEGEPLGDDALVMDEGEPAPTVGAASGAGGYEVPFSLMQCLALLFIILTLSLGGMLMSDLVRNMWAYSETAAPVSSLTDSLISLMGLE